MRTLARTFGGGGGRRGVLAVGPVDRLIEVDHRARDHLRRVAEQVGDHRGDVLRTEQAAERAAGIGLREPAGGLPGAGLHAVLALGRGPADVQPVHADAVRLQLIPGVAGERGQRALGGRVSGEDGLASVTGHRDDVDDAAAVARPPHQPGGVLHEQERRPHVDGEQAIPQLDARVVQRAAAAEARGVDEAVQASEALLARADHGHRRLGLGQVCRDERGLTAERLELLADRLPAIPVPAADDDAGRSQPRGAARDRRAETLRAAGDDQHPAVEPLRGERIAHIHFRSPVVDCLTTSSGCRTTRRCTWSGSPAASASSRSAAVRPISCRGRRTDVSGIAADDANSMSSKPTIAKSSGTFTP